MRLSEIRDYVTNILDYDPTSTTFSGQVDDIINDCNRRLFAEKPFVFAQKEVIISAKVDESVTATIALGATLVTIAGSVLPTWIEGHIFEIGDVEYNIIFRASNTTFYVSEAVTAAFTSITGTIKMRYLDLPQDCVQVMQVMKRAMAFTPIDPGRMVPLTRYEDEWWNLPLNEINLPNYWVQYDDYNIVAPRKVNAAAVTSGAGHGVRTIDVAMTYQFGNGNNGFRESALSKSITLALVDTEQLQINFTALGADSGIYRKIYVRCPDQELNVWRLLPSTGTTATQPAAPTKSGVDTFTGATLTALTAMTFEQDAPRYTYSDGNTQRIRLYPRQDATYDMSVRYLYRPARLVEAHDTPEFPAAHHLMLAYMALEQIFMKTDNLNQSQMYKMKADQEMVKMEKRYLTQAPKRWVKQFMPDGQTESGPIYSTLRHIT